MAIIHKAKALRDCHVGNKCRREGDVFQFIGPLEPWPPYLEHMETIGGEKARDVLAQAEDAIEAEKAALWAEINKLGITGLHPNTGVKKLKESISSYKVQMGLEAGE